MVSITITIKVYHCANSDGLFDQQIGFGTHSVCQCKVDDGCDGDGDGNGTCKWTLNLNDYYNCTTTAHSLTAKIRFLIISRAKCAHTTFQFFRSLFCFPSNKLFQIEKRCQIYPFFCSFFFWNSIAIFAILLVLVYVAYPRCENS